MVLGNLFFLLAALIAAAVMDYQIRQEEEYLSGLYGESYRLYRAKVNRYVGGRL
jgi:protein-S-isoprenylcysteine O-methyltransferase Ste14